MNQVILTGRLTKDPELRQTQSNKAVTSFSVAVNETKEKTVFINCVAWEKTAENIAKYFKKGNPIMVVGSWENRSYEKEGVKRTVSECRVYRFEFMGESGIIKDEAKPTFIDIEEEGELPF